MAESRSQDSLLIRKTSNYYYKYTKNINDFTNPRTTVTTLFVSCLRSCKFFDKFAKYSLRIFMVFIFRYSVFSTSSPPILATSRFSASWSLFRSFKISLTKTFWASFSPSTCFTISWCSFFIPLRVSSKCEGPFAKKRKNSKF